MRLCWLAPGILLITLADIAGASEIKLVSSITGREYKIVAAAVPAFNRVGLKLEEYRIEIVDFGEEFVVFFEDKDSPSAFDKKAYPDGIPMGSIGKKRRTFEVRLSKLGLRVLYSDFGY